MHQYNEIHWTMFHTLRAPFIQERFLFFAIIDTNTFLKSHRPFIQYQNLSSKLYHSNIAAALDLDCFFQGKFFCSFHPVVVCSRVSAGANFDRKTSAAHFFSNVQLIEGCAGDVFKQLTHFAIWRNSTLSLPSPSFPFC